MNAIDKLILDWWKDIDELDSLVDGQMYNKMMNEWMDE